ncbi:unnamed protein product [Orchesella dallaii]|uniref:Uncharacterized protein n=1 Tax=Orchesella dallaii TaxID=48710 RepID=A0ABP1PPE0_9HEXA
MNKNHSMDHLGFHTMDLLNAKKIFNKSRELVTCSPPAHLDPRTHLNGPFISIRKVQKHQDLARIQSLEERRNKLRALIHADRQKWQCELSKQGLTLYTDTLL